MEFISAEEFLKQPKEVQKVFLDWWEPSKGDVYCNLYNDQQDNTLVINDCQLEIFKTFKDDIKQYGCPLLTEGQLRQFIEDIAKCKVLELRCNCDDGEYFIESYQNKYSCVHNDKWVLLGDNVLKAYWKVALEIAKEKVKE